LGGMHRNPTDPTGKSTGSKVVELGTQGPVEKASTKKRVQGAKRPHYGSRVPCRPAADKRKGAPIARRGGQHRR